MTNENLKEVKEALLEMVWSLYEEELAVAIRLCSDTVFFSPILSVEILGEMAEHIIEICEEWKWL